MKTHETVSISIEWTATYSFGVSDDIWTDA